jgi:hypothetical protein
MMGMRIVSVRERKVSWDLGVISSSRTALFYDIFVEQLLLVIYVLASYRLSFNLDPFLKLKVPCYKC